MMLHPYSFSIILRTLRPQALSQVPLAARFSTTRQRAEESLSKVVEQTPEPQAQLPYFIHRSKTNNLPVYQETRNSNRKQTRIRKVDGDTDALRQDVIKLLGKDKESVSINGLTKQIIIKGWYKKDIVNWLKDLRF